MVSVITASVTIMASVTYGKCNLWQVLLMVNVIMAKVFMAKVLWQMKLSHSFLIREGYEVKVYL